MSICFDKKLRLGPVLASMFFLVLAPNPIEASEEKVEKVEKPESVVLAPVTDYCESIKNPATEARYALQFKKLEDLQKKIDEKIALLDEKYQKNVAFENQQKEKMKAAQKVVVDIYSNMKPDIAAGQLELLDPEIAVAILDQLKVRVASSILNEMKGPSAAIITSMMAIEAKVQKP
jgi:flagellar motility protein MotE (MotC chaperone)